MLSPFALVLTSLSLSADAFAAALARGSAAPQSRLGSALKVGAVFGSTEGLMCLGGWLLAHSMANLITALDHWIALVLLAAIGGRMVWNGWRGEEDEDAEPRNRTRIGTVVTAIGTSIDSAAVGVALALALAPFWIAGVIGLTSFALSTLGYLIGPRVGERFGGYAEIAGGLVLIGLGISIFTSHVTA